MHNLGFCFSEIQHSGEDGNTYVYSYFNLQSFPSSKAEKLFDEYILCYRIKKKKVIHRSLNQHRQAEQKSIHGHNETYKIKDFRFLYKYSIHYFFSDIKIY